MKEIYWAYYSWKSDTRYEHLDAVPNVESLSLVDRLHHTEWLCRKRGKHVLSDEQGIWVFSLSQAEKEDVHRVLDSDGFTCTLSGTERSSDIAATFRPGTSVSNSGNTAASAFTVPGDSGRSNVQAFSANSNAASPMDLVDPLRNVLDAELTYSCTKMASAISQSLCYALTNETTYIQVGLSSCIDVETLADVGVEDLGVSKPFETTTSISFGIDWLRSGSLLITYRCKDLARLQRVSWLLSQDQKLFQMPLGLPLLLSPSGKISQYLGVDTTSRQDLSYDSRSELKASVSARLARIGIVLPSDPCWIRVLLEGHPSAGEPDQSTSSSTDPLWTIWPASCCLCKEVVAVHEQDETAVDTMPDPLATAESWFLSGAGRLKALELKQRQMDLEAQRAQGPGETDEEDALSDLEIQVTQGITPQDVSGIYPTPPDGIRSSLADSSPNELPTHVDRETDQNVQSMPGALARPYAEHESGDLFDEIEMDMFTANGLTEADFSFFDEPSPIYGHLPGDADAVATIDDLPSMNRVDATTRISPTGNLRSGATPRNEDHVINASPALDSEVLTEIPSMYACIQNPLTSSSDY